MAEFSDMRFAHTEGVCDLVFSPDGRVVTCGADGEVSGKVARWQNLIPSFPWIASGWRAWGRNPRKGRDQILQRSLAEP